MPSPPISKASLVVSAVSSLTAHASVIKNYTNAVFFRIVYIADTFGWSKLSISNEKGSAANVNTGVKHSLSVWVESPEVQIEHTITHLFLESFGPLGPVKGIIFPHPKPKYTSLVAC